MVAAGRTWPSRRGAAAEHKAGAAPQTASSELEPAAAIPASPPSRSSKLPGLPVCRLHPASACGPVMLQVLRALCTGLEACCSGAAVPALKALEAVARLALGRSAGVRSSEGWCAKKQILRWQLGPCLHSAV
jgi:hypothetical protein